MKEIRTDGLRRLIGESFGFNLGSQKLICESASCDNEMSQDSSAIEIVDEALKERAGRRLLAEEINKQKNLEDVVQRADDILQAEKYENTQEVLQGRTDQGWVDDCLDGAGKAYDDNLKDYWAKLLAGEIKNPGFYSKRTIQLMKSLSKNDADKIRKMCQYIVYNYDNTDAVILRYNPSDYTFDEISFLMELRLLNYNHSIVKQYRFDGNDGFGFFRKKDVGLFVKMKRKEYNFPIYSFTELGKEILTIIDDVDVNRKYLKDFSKSITEKKDFLEVTCGDLVEVGDHYQFAKNDNYFEIPVIGNDISLDTRKD